MFCVNIIISKAECFGRIIRFSVLKLAFPQIRFQAKPGVVKMLIVFSKILFRFVGIIYLNASSLIIWWRWRAIRCIFDIRPSISPLSFRNYLERSTIFRKRRKHWDTGILHYNISILSRYIGNPFETRKLPRFYDKLFSELPD